MPRLGVKVSGSTALFLIDQSEGWTALQRNRHSHKKKTTQEGPGWREKNNFEGLEVEWLSDLHESI